MTSHLLGVGSLNTHVQASVGKGALQQLQDAGALPLVDALALQEVRDPVGMVAALHRATGDTWSIAPDRPEHPNRRRGPMYLRRPALSYVATRDRTMRFVDAESRDVTSGGKYLRQQAIARAEHIATSRVCVVGSVHNETGRTARKYEIRAAQIAPSVSRMGRVLDDRFGIIIGDWNETIGNGLAHARGATHRAHAGGLRSTGLALGMGAAAIGIDGGWFTPRPFARPHKRREFRVPAMREGIRPGHPFVVEQFEIEAV